MQTKEIWIKYNLHCSGCGKSVILLNILFQGNGSMNVEWLCVICGIEGETQRDIFQIMADIIAIERGDKGYATPEPKGIQ